MSGPDSAFIEQHTEVVELDDGSQVLVRPITPDDKDGLQDGLRRLSPQSRYLRFFSDVDSLSARELRYLTEIDYVDHFALVAVEHPPPNDRPGGVAVGRYIRLAGEPEVAEAAVAVVDDWQGKGIGRLLTTRLAHVAAENGVRRFRVYVLPENAWLIDRLGGITMVEGDDVYVVDVPLSPPDLARMAQAMLARIARQPGAAHTDIPTSER